MFRQKSFRIWRKFHKSFLLFIKRRPKSKKGQVTVNLFRWQVSSSNSEIIVEWIIKKLQTYPRSQQFFLAVYLPTSQFCTDVVNERACSSYLALDSNVKILLYKLTYENSFWEWKTQFSLRTNFSSLLFFFITHYRAFLFVAELVLSASLFVMSFNCKQFW